MLCIFAANSNLRRHIRNVHENMLNGDKKYPTIKCTECDRQFWGSLEMYEHSKIHDKNSHERNDGYNLWCDACHIDMETFDNYAAHMKTVHDVTNDRHIKPVRCRWCGERCRTLQGLYTHIRLVHTCDKNLPNNLMATSDMINMAPVEKTNTFLCTVCGKVLSSRISYRNHMVVHSGVKKFVCDICSARFRYVNQDIQQLTAINFLSIPILSLQSKVLFEQSQVNAFRRAQIHLHRVR